MNFNNLDTKHVVFELTSDFSIMFQKPNILNILESDQTIFFTLATKIKIDVHDPENGDKSLLPKQIEINKIVGTDGKPIVFDLRKLIRPDTNKDNLDDSNKDNPDDSDIIFTVFRFNIEKKHIAIAFIICMLSLIVIVFWLQSTNDNIMETPDQSEIPTIPIDII
jgi:hypothetical protein